MTATTNSQPLKILLQKCKSWDLIENIFLCLSLVLIDLQRHTVPHFNPDVGRGGQKGKK